MVMGFESNSSHLVFEINRLHNQLKEKEMELGVADAEIKALKATQLLKGKALQELSDDLRKSHEKLALTEKYLDQKNLEIKKITNEKKDAVAAQFAAEATLRRLHANHKETDTFRTESIIAPIEANLKTFKNEIAVLQEDNKALVRLSKSKESALVEAESILKSALERALIVEEVQNHNCELKRLIEICQEENRILDKTNRRKVIEVEKLSKTIQQLEEALLAGGAAANVNCDYKRQISELHEEKRTLERELARVKVTENRVASVAANEWKDENDKVVPIKQWLNERKLLQGEMQRLREKLAVTERTAKAEAQLKDKLKLRLKTIEQGLKLHVSGEINYNAASCTTPKSNKCNKILGFLSNESVPRKRCLSQSRKVPISNVENETTGGGAEMKTVRKNLWASTTSQVADSGKKENTEMKSIIDIYKSKFHADHDDKVVLEDIGFMGRGNEELQTKVGAGEEDIVSGYLYDRLQRQVISLTKSCEVKETTLIAKDEQIKTLMNKVDKLTKAMEVESRRVKREAVTTAREKDAIQIKVNESKNIKNTAFPKGSV